jgi:hypothetical protein
MTNDQLTGKYTRLRNELEVAYAEPAWNLGRSGRIDRIANELAEIERVLAVQRLAGRLITVDESFGDRPASARFSLA